MNLGSHPTLLNTVGYTHTLTDTHTLPNPPPFPPRSISPVLTDLSSLLRLPLLNES